MKWKIHACGTRGSFPRTDRQYQNYGMNTSCFLVDCGVPLFLDAGSGIFAASNLIESEVPVHILLSHVHLDHVMGLFECPFLYEKDREIHIYGESRGGKDIEEQLNILIGPPYWPIRLSDFPADIHFHDICEGDSIHISPLEIRAERAYHPDKTLMFSLEDGKKKVVYSLDYEIAEDKDGRLETFAENADVLICDGNNLPERGHPGWGHSSWKEAADLSGKVNAKLLLIAHYGYDCSDEELLKEEKEAKRQNILFVREGDVIEL